MAFINIADLDTIELERTFIDDMISNFNKVLGDEFEKCVRVMAEPPVKGEVTKGKLKWRGIVLKVKRNDFTSDEYWIEQRGKKISPIYTIEMPKLFDEPFNK